jgi:hypothetical protein
MIATTLFALIGLTWGQVLGTAAVFLGSFALSLVVVAVLLVRLPADYFLDSHDRELWIDQHPVIRWSGKIAKNAFGAILILLGLALSLPLVPGQGLLTILIGLMLLDFPGKRRLERRILGRPGVFRRVNRLRQAFGRDPLMLLERPAKRALDHPDPKP